MITPLIAMPASSSPDTAHDGSEGERFGGGQRGEGLGVIHRYKATYRNGPQTPDQRHHIEDNKKVVDTLNGNCDMI